MRSLVPALSILVAAIANTSYALMAGSALAHFWLRDLTDVARRLLRSLGIGSLVALIACHAVRPWFVAASMSGSTRFGEVLGLVPTILSATRQGGLWYANCVALAVLAVALFVALRGVTAGRWMMLAAWSVLAATKAASSHASGDGDFTLAEISEWVHLLATAVWAGTVVVSGLLVAPRLVVLPKASAFWDYGRRLSKTVTWALCLLVLSGLYAAWRDMHGNLSELWTGAWGKILLAKVTFVLLALSLGSLSRFRCLAMPPTNQRANLMVRLLRAEAIVMLAILGLSSVLANTSPAG